MKNTKATQVEFHIHELNILLTLLWRSGEAGKFPLTHNHVLDLLSMMQKKADEAGIIFEELNNEHK
ncbi:MAG: hypothetical protein ACJAS1_006955 [Oleiphilaceae bacterium]|jgi:hypothetical protein